MSDPARTVADRLRSHHRDVLESVVDVADAVADEWDGDATTDRESVVPPLREGLADAGLIDRFPAVLTDLIEAVGRSPPAEIVPGPPYVAVTSVGPVLRATLSDGRLVATLRAFAVDRSDGVRYRRGPADPDELPEVRFR